MKQQTMIILLSIALGLAIGTNVVSSRPAQQGQLEQTTQSTAFAYQGRLDDGGKPANAVYDFQFVLYTAAVGGAQVGSIVTRDDLAVSNGLFSVSLDFGSVFTGAARFLEVGVRPGTSTGSYTALSPRSELLAAPWAQFARTIYTRTVVVSPLATPRESGTHLLEALGQIADASAEQPYTLKIEPGIYDLGDGSLRMKEHVDIEGSGEGVTTITAAGVERASSAAVDSGTVIGANNAEIRQLTIENTGKARTPPNSTHAVALFNNDVNLRAHHVTVIAKGARVNIGVKNNSSNVTLDNFTIKVIGESGEYSYGIQNASSTPLLTSLRVYCNSKNGEFICISNNRSSPVIKQAIIHITSSSILGVVGIANYEANYPDPILLTDIVLRIEATDGSGNVTGISNQSSSPSINNVRVEINGGGGEVNTGISNVDIAWPEIHNSTIRMSGPYVLLQRGITNSTNTAGGTVQVVNSQIIMVHGGVPITIEASSYANPNFSVYVGSSLLSSWENGRRLTTSGTGFRCVGVYDKYFYAVGSNCQ